jgi:hypothetical protein
LAAITKPATLRRLLPRRGNPELLTSIARDAKVGLSNDTEGLVQISAAGDLDLLCFVEVALDRCAPDPPPQDATPD